MPFYLCAFYAFPSCYIVIIPQPVRRFGEPYLGLWRRTFQKRGTNSADCFRKALLCQRRGANFLLRRFHTSAFRRQLPLRPRQRRLPLSGLRPDVSLRRSFRARNATQLRGISLQRFGAKNGILLCRTPARSRLPTHLAAAQDWRLMPRQPDVCPFFRFRKV